VPPELIVELLKTHNIKKKNSDQYILLEGFPSNLEEYEVWSLLMKDEVELPFAIFLDVDDENEKMNDEIKEEDISTSSK